MHFFTYKDFTVKEAEQLRCSVLCGSTLTLGGGVRGRNGGGWGSGADLRGRVGACRSRLNGGHRSVEMRPEEQLTGDLVDHEVLSNISAPRTNQCLQLLRCAAREPPAHWPL